MIYRLYHRKLKSLGKAWQWLNDLGVNTRQCRHPGMEIVTGFIIGERYTRNQERQDSEQYYHFSFSQVSGLKFRMGTLEP